jgi:hypothetical protein
VSLTLEQDDSTDALIESVMAFAKLPGVSAMLSSKEVSPSLSTTRTEIANFSSVRLPCSFRSALGNFGGSVELIAAEALLSKAQLDEQWQPPAKLGSRPGSPLVSLSLGRALGNSQNHAFIRSSRSSRS